LLSFRSETYFAASGKAAR